MQNTKKLIKNSKTILITILAIYFTIVVIGNLIDYQTNFMFVEHVLKMDTTFQPENLMHRSINSPIMYHLFYWIIILTEIIIATLLWKGTIKLWNKKEKIQDKGKTFAIKGMTLSMILWFGYFITIGGEWFLMWQSSTWNGIDAAFRMFSITALIFLIFINKN